MEAGTRTPPSSSWGWLRIRASAAALLLWAAASLFGCASLPPGANYPKQASTAYEHPQATRIAERFADAAAAHPGESAFRILSRGADGFALRMQLIDTAEHSLDLQYFIYHLDQTGQLITEALLRAAERGVHLRILVDDGATLPGDHRIRILAAHPQIEVRVFNPFSYRGNSMSLRALDFAFHHHRLDYRMHNKLMLVDNASALIGGRNIGDQYFQIDPQGQYADDDVFAVGPVVPQLSATFDTYWNSALAIPVAALADGAPTASELTAYRSELASVRQKADELNPSYLVEAASGRPLSSIMTGELPLAWASAQVVCDAPDKQHTHKNIARSTFGYDPLSQVVGNAQSELLMITPYFIPTPAESQVLKDLRARNVRVGFLTNSLESTTEVSAHSGYQRHRLEMLQEGVEIHEVRASPESARGSGQSVALSRHGNYGLHAKLYTVDRAKLFIGSMNFDQRSAWLNTEVGLIIDSTELAGEAVARYEAMTQLENAYEVSLQPDAVGHTHLTWRTRVGDQIVVTRHEPSRNFWRGLQDDFLLMLPIDDEL